MAGVPCVCNSWFGWHTYPHPDAPLGCIMLPLLRWQRVPASLVAGNFVPMAACCTAARSEAMMQGILSLLRQAWPVEDVHLHTAASVDFPWLPAHDDRSSGTILLKAAEYPAVWVVVAAAQTACLHSTTRRFSIVWMALWKVHLS